MNEERAEGGQKGRWQVGGGGDATDENEEVLREADGGEARKWRR